MVAIHVANTAGLAHTLLTPFYIFLDLKMVTSHLRLSLHLFHVGSKVITRNNYTCDMMSMNVTCYIFVDIHTRLLIHVDINVPGKLKQGVYM